MKNIFKNINEVAQVNIEKAVGMVEMLNMLKGTQYCIVARRVCYFEDEFGAMVAPYKQGCYSRDAEWAME